MKKFILLVVVMIIATTVWAQDSLTENIVFPKDIPTSPKNTLSIYPIPTNGPFTIAMNSLEKTFSITIYSIVGKIIYEIKDLPTNLGVSFEPIDKGLYFYVAVCNKSIYRGKILIH